jgi:hypothetical protein
LAIGAPLATIEEEVVFIFASFLPNTQGLSFINNVCFHLALFCNLFPTLHAFGCVACGLSLFAPSPNRAKTHYGDTILAN